MEKITLGIDIGGTNTVFGFVNRNGSIIAQGTMSTQAYPEINDYIKALCTQVQTLLKSLSNVELVGAGIGAPNGNFHKGTVEQAANLSWKGIIPFVEMFQKNIDVPTFLTNDANAAAIGEMIYGGAQEMKDFIVITLGTGLGSGIVVNGELVYGHDGFAGELGHVVVKEGGRTCGCGRNGCLETYGSATGITRTVFELMSLYREDSVLRKIPYSEMTSKKIYDAAIADDFIAKLAFEKTGEIIGKALADFIAFSSPQAIFLFGGLAQSGDLILKPTEKAMNTYVLNVFKNKTQLLLSKLDGANAAVLGSSALAWQQLNKKLMA